MNEYPLLVLLACKYLPSIFISTHIPLTKHELLTYHVPLSQVQSVISKRLSALKNNPLWKIFWSTCNRQCVQNVSLDCSERRRKLNILVSLQNQKPFHIPPPQPSSVIPKRSQNLCTRPYPHQRRIPKSKIQTRTPTK